MLNLSDDEVLDFVAAGSMRAFTILCMRKLPWLALCAQKAHGDLDRALTGAGRVMVAVWENAPLWPPRSGRLDRRLLDLLDTRSGSIAPDPSDGITITDEHIAALLRQVVSQCAPLPQKRQGLLGRWLG
ncbi:hypothetical protein [Magnetospirillum sulfuroxidans]|uniref:Uncharacterized protein n=1 Tax=Magnetospirillum sulfuroxidans TaxID=611300 RepID=A0ABS5IFH9_9PROT|nr:hypothetical protein [Magnetospirillum sulfuroxidans]MBR9972483.1 hypothetical protein [Magnetospirillum sulfuroxidans]